MLGPCGSLQARDLFKSIAWLEHPDAR